LQEKEWWVLVWNIALNIIYLPCDFLYLAFFYEYNPFPLFLLVLELVLQLSSVASLLYYVKERGSCDK